MANFNLIYGRSGAGKSEFIYKDINKKIDKFDNIYIIVPEQSNLSSERKFFEITRRKAMLNVQVLTLSRMAFTIANEIGGSKESLSKVGKSMIIYDILSKNKKELNFLGKSEKNIDIVDRMFTEFKKHNVSIEDLENLNLDDKYIELKLNDIKLLYNKYEEKINDKFIDENDELTQLAQNIEKSDMFNNSAVYIDDFYGFTPQEYIIFEEIVKKCAEINVSICVDKIESTRSKEGDIFYFNRKYAKKLLEISDRQNCKLNLINMYIEYRFKNDELISLEKSLYSGKGAYNEELKNIELFLATNPYSEVENTAKEIYNLVKEQGYKYNEIGIVATDIESYGEDAKAIFKNYDIPIFIDEKKDLNQNILIRYILSLLEIFERNWTYESVFNYLKIGLLDIEYYDICLLENYCIKWGIKGKKWHKEFAYEPINDIQEKLENIRKKFVEPLVKFKQNFMQNKTVADLTSNIYKFLVENNVISNLDKKIKETNNIEISNEYNTSYKILINIFEEMINLFGDEKITFDKYKDLLIVGINSAELGKIPASQDQVVFGDIDRTRSNNIKVLFVLGMNDGIFPKANRQEGYLNDSDRNILLENGIELAKTSIDAVYESNFNIYRTLTIPEEKLYLSFHQSDKEGGSVRPSIMIKKIKRFLPKLKEKSNVVSKEYVVTNEKVTFEEALEVYAKYLEGEEMPEMWKELLIYFNNKDKKSFKKAISGMNYTNTAEKISIKNIKKLYGNTLKTTISRLENYRRCPFSFHMTYGLKLKENEGFQMSSLDTGSFMHEVIDTFFEYIEEKEIDLKEISDEEILQIVSKIIDDILNTSRYYVFSSSAKFKMMTRRLKKVVQESMKYIIYSLKYSDFNPIGHEVEFGGKVGDYKPINLTLESGENVEIIGKIDRLDLGKLNDKEYVRIIDYKSQIKKVDLNQVVAGLQIQLITYLDAVTEQDNFDPAGILYLGLVDNIVKAKKNLNDEEIDKEIKKGFKMQGLILADVQVVKMMDNKLEQGYSDIVPAYISKDGTLSERSSSIANEREFEILQNRVKQTIKELSTEILQGNIDIKPYNYQKKTGCDYCKYKSICMFNPNMKGNDYFYIYHKNNNDILNNLVSK